MTHREAQDFSIGLGLSFVYKQGTESNGNSIEFFLSNADKGAVGFIPAQELATLIVDRSQDWEIGDF